MTTNEQTMKALRAKLAVGEEALNKARAKLDATALELKKATDEADDCEVQLAQMKVLVNALETGSNYVTVEMCRDECRIPHDRFDASVRRMILDGRMVG